MSSCTIETYIYVFAYKIVWSGQISYELCNLDMGKFGNLGALRI